MQVLQMEKKTGLMRKSLMMMKKTNSKNWTLEESQEVMEQHAPPPSEVTPRVEQVHQGEVVAADDPRSHVPA